MRMKKLACVFAMVLPLCGLAGSVQASTTAPANGQTKAHLLRLLATLKHPGGLERYGFFSGQLVWAQACLDSVCVSHRFGPTKPRCSGGVCLAPAAEARRYPNGLTISVLLW